MRRFIYILTFTILSFSCKKGKVDTGETVEIYLLKDYKLLTGKCQVDTSLSVIQGRATIKNKDIIEYSKADYKFTLTRSAFKTVEDFHDSTPFAITVNKKIIYFGIYKQYTSSLGCGNSIIMSLAAEPGNKISLKLGYPGTLQDVTIDDQRNNPKLIAALNNQGKLR